MQLFKNGSNSDIEMNQFAGIDAQKKLSTVIQPLLFQCELMRKKSSKLVSKPATLPGGLGMTNFAFAIIFNYGGPEVLNKTTFC